LVGLYFHRLFNKKTFFPTGLFFSAKEPVKSFPGIFRKMKIGYCMLQGTAGYRVLQGTRALQGAGN